MSHLQHGAGDYHLALTLLSINWHYERSLHPDLLRSYNHVMLERYRELFDLTAGSPVEVVTLADNITSDVVGRERFRSYVMPVYKLLKESIASTGKLLGVHMDGRLNSLVKEIGEANFDFVEALTPPPMGDVSVREARAAWPEKGLWLNFTSCMHIESPEVIATHTRQLLEEAGSKRGFAMGVTEDAPVEALERSLAVIARVLNDF